MSRERERYDNEVGKKIKREIDASFDQMGRRHILGSTLNTITPCAACKLLRRRCAEECPFSPYFSPHEPHKFAVVHKVFGASNVSKMLMEVPDNQRADAANSLVYEANVRLRDPVYGCMGAISALQQQVQSLHAELNAVRGEILKYKYREAASNIMASTHAALATSGADVAVVVAPAAQPPVTPNPPPPTTPPPPPPRPPPPSVVVVSSSSSLYTTPVAASVSYTSAPNNSVPYFG